MVGLGSFKDVYVPPQSEVDKCKFLDPEKVIYIVVHCTDTSCSNDITVDEFDSRAKGRGYPMIGYHYIVRPDGSIIYGRPIELEGNHCVMYNSRSIGVAYVGGRNSAGAPKDTRTFAQKISMAWLFGDIITRFPHIVEIVGHNDLVSTWCPMFNVKGEYSNFISKFRDGQTF